MPDEEKKTVPIDTSGPDVDINLPEEKKTRLVVSLISKSKKQKKQKQRKKKQIKHLKTNEKQS